MMSSSSSALPASLRSTPNNANVNVTAAQAAESSGLARLLRDAVLHLCRTNAIYVGPVEVDGLICISGQKEGQQVVVKLHDRIGNERDAAVKSLFFPEPDGENNHDVYDYPPHHHHHHLQHNNLHFHHQHHNGEDIGSDGELPPLNKRFKDDESPYGDDQAEDLSSTGGTSNYDAPSPAGSDTPLKNNQYLGKSAYLPSPYHLQKKTPLRSERWTPTMPIPTTPECKACGFTFENFDVLSEHNEAVHSVFTCNSCHKTFTSRSNLERHSRLHTGFKPYVCAICQKAFSRKDHLSNHAAKHAFKCATCNKRFADKKSLASHYTYEHEAPLSHVCDFCNKGFSNQDLYEEHIKTHPQYHAVQRAYHYSSSPPPPMTQRTPSGKLNCPQCPFTSQDRIQLLKHCLQHTDSHRCYTCLSCAKTFSDPLKYEEHLVTLHKSEHNVFECCLCRQIFPTLDILKQHEQAHLNDEEAAHQHMLMNAHRCAFCQQGFGSFAELNQHMHELRHYPVRPTDLSMHTPPPGFPFRHHDHQQQHQQREEDSHIPEEREDHEEKDSERSEKVKSEPESEHQQKQQQQQDDVDDDDEEEVDVGQVEENMQHQMSNGRDSEEPINSPNPDQAPTNGPKDLDNEDIGSDIEVVEPEAPEDTENTDDGRINGSPLDNEHDDNSAIKIEPLRSLLSSGKQINERSRKRKAPSPEKFVPPPPPYVEPAMGGYYRPVEPFEIVPQDLSMKTGLMANNHMNAMAARAAAAFAEEHLRAAHERYRLDLEKLERERQERDRYEKMQRERDSQRTPQPSKPGIEIPPGPQTCSVCNTTYSSFQEMETHCFVEHNRSPCMFCSKTFAQKANRDRHVCLHTGDKPYSCPDCDEKFSRGDKLKLHRVRAHNLQVSSSPAAGGGGGGGRKEPGIAGSEWSSASDDSWVASYKKESDIVHAGGEWSMVRDGPPPPPPQPQAQATEAAP